MDVSSHSTSYWSFIYYSECLFVGTAYFPDNHQSLYIYCSSMSYFAAFLYIAFNSIINILLHCFGLYLLMMTKIKRSSKAINHLYLVNFSVSELLKSVSYILYATLRISDILGKDAVHNVHIYVLNILLPLTHSLCFIAIIVLVSDRIFLALYGSNVYIFSSWDQSRGKSLLLLLWGLVAVIFVIMYEVIGVFDETIKILSMNLVTVIDVLCIGLVILMYISVYRILLKMKSKFREALRRYPDFEDSLNVSDNGYSFRAAVRSVQYYFLTQFSGSDGRIRDYLKHCSYGHSLKQSPFYTTVLLTSSFVALAVLPTLILSVTSLAQGYVQDNLLIFVHISTSLSDTVNGIVYISTYQCLFKLFMKKVKTKYPWFTRKIHPVIENSNSNRCCRHFNRQHQNDYRSEGISQES